MTRRVKPVEFVDAVRVVVAPSSLPFDTPSQNLDAIHAFADRLRSMLASAASVGSVKVEIETSTICGHCGADWRPIRRVDGRWLCPGCSFLVSTANIPTS